MGKGIDTLTACHILAEKINDQDGSFLTMVGETHSASFLGLNSNRCLVWNKDVAV